VTPDASAELREWLVELCVRWEQHSQDRTAWKAREAHAYGRCAADLRAVLNHAPLQAHSDPTSTD